MFITLLWLIKGVKKMTRTVNRERKIVPYEECYIDFEMSLGEVLKEIKQLIKAYGEEAYIEGYTDQYSNSDRKTYHVFTKKPETDDQYNTRIAYEEKWTKESEARDAAEFARLSAKFGKI
jgi:hypothetical protein